MSKQLLLRLIEKVVAPADGRGECLLPGWRISRTADEKRQSSFQPLEESIGRQHTQPGCRQLDRQGQAIETRTDVGHDSGLIIRQYPLCAYTRAAIEEQSHGLVCSELLGR